jgi:hypothetical protein
MELHFQNDTESTIWVCIMFYSPDGCADYGSWGTRGWWAMGPNGGQAYVLNTDNSYAAYYAESDSGGVWSGSYGPVYVHQTGFDSCVDIGDNSPETRIVGMRLVDMTGYDSYYLHLTN